MAATAHCSRYSAWWVTMQYPTNRRLQRRIVVLHWANPGYNLNHVAGWIACERSVKTHLGRLKEHSNPVKMKALQFIGKHQIVASNIPRPRSLTCNHEELLNYQETLKSYHSNERLPSNVVGKSHAQLQEQLHDALCPGNTRQSYTSAVRT